MEKADYIENLYAHNEVKSPNILWKLALGIEDGGIDLIPKEGKNYILPVIPSQIGPSAGFHAVLSPQDVSGKSKLSSALDENYARRFVASDPNVLVFDAGNCIYVTDSRDDNRTTLEFTLESKIVQSYRYVFLAPDATSFTVEPATEQTDQGWTKKMFLPAGCSMLLVHK